MRCSLLRKWGLLRWLFLSIAECLLREGFPTCVRQVSISCNTWVRLLIDFGSSFGSQDWNRVKTKNKEILDMFKIRVLWLCLFLNLDLILTVHLLNGLFRLGSKLCCLFQQRNSVYCTSSSVSIHRSLLIAFFCSPPIFIFQSMVRIRTRLCSMLLWSSHGNGV